MNWNYQPEDHETKVPPEGDYLMTVLGIEEKMSQSGNPMIVVEMQPEGYEMKFKYRMVAGDYFNRMATSFFDAFKLPRGDFNFAKWKYARGMAHLAKGKPNQNGKQYMEVKYLITDTAGTARPQPTMAEAKTQYVTPSVEVPHDDGFSDSIPF